MKLHLTAINTVSIHFVVLIALNILERVNSSNILVVSPTPSFSHQQACVGLARILAKRGHNVTAIVTNPKISEPIPNYHEIDLSLLYKVWEQYQIDANFSLQTKISPFETIREFDPLFALFLDEMYQQEPIQQLLRSKMKFDLIIYEGMYPGALGFVHHFNYPPSIVFFTIANYIPLRFSMGNPINPSYVSSFLLEYSDKMTFFQRLKNTIYVLYELYRHNYHLHRLQDVVVKKHFGDEVPSVSELEKNNSLLLLNGDLSNSYPAPNQPNTLYFSTVHVDKTQTPLPQDLKKWMDEAEDGVIYFSFGSNMKGISVPEEKRNAFAKAFAKFPKFRVLWKWESDVEFPGKPSNVLLRKWLPQQAVLGHPKVKLFITQGGHQSRQEAVHFGVPVLTVPMFWDQAWNGKRIEVARGGLLMDFYEITDADVYNRINLLLTDTSFKKNMVKLSKISKDAPLSSEETVGWWIEYVIRHKGAPHLRPAVQDLKWYQYTLLDVAAFILSVIFVTLYITYFVIKRVFSCLINNGTKKIKPE